MSSDLWLPAYNLCNEEQDASLQEELGSLHLQILSGGGSGTCITVQDFAVLPSLLPALWLGEESGP